MARIRSIHPSLFTDEAWVSCTPFARVLYIGLLTEADDQGLFEWKPLQIKMRLLPGDGADVSTLLAELTEANLIAPLDSAGKRLGAIRRFCKFQRPKKPTKHFTLPAEWRTYVGYSAESSEPDESEGPSSGEPDRDERPPVPHQFPTSSELGEQKEDGGGNREESNEEADASSGVRDAPEGDKGPKRSRRKPEKPIPDDYPDAAAIAEAQARFRAAGADLDASVQAERFRNHAQQNDRLCRDWPAAWRNWIISGIEKAPKRPPPATVAARWAGPPEVAAAMARAFGPEKGAGYLAAYCTWRDVPTKALICSQNLICDFIRREAGPAFEALGVTVLLEDRAA